MTIFNFNILALMVFHIIRLFKNQFRTAQGSNSMVNAERDHNSRGLGTEPQWGSRGQSPRWELRGAKPSEAECLFVFACPKEAANLPHY